MQIHLHFVMMPSNIDLLNYFFFFFVIKCLETYTEFMKIILSDKSRLNQAFEMCTIVTYFSICKVECKVMYVWYQNRYTMVYLECILILQRNEKNNVLVCICVGFIYNYIYIHKPSSKPPVLRGPNPVSMAEQGCVTHY